MSDPTSFLQPAATQVRDPLSGRSVWLAGMIKNPRPKGDADLIYDLHFEAAHTVEQRQQITEAIATKLAEQGFGGKVYAMPAGSPPKRPASGGTPRVSQAQAGGGDPVKGMSGPGMAPHGGPIVKKALEGVKHIIAVASGKGGVGKSTVSSNLAVALQQAGFQVGLLDADVYGPSVPTMMGASARPMVDGQRKRILPVEAHGVKCLSMGQLVDEEEAMIWRGPMVMGAIRQFIQDADWSGLDYLVVDLPPGTGDVQLSLIQAVQLSGAIIVTTPQQVALADAVRGVTMFQKLDVPLLGLIENMAWYELPDGTRDYVFGQGGGLRVAERYDTEVLGQVPLRSQVRIAGDGGTPVALSSDPVAASFAAMAKRVAEKVPV